MGKPELSNGLVYEMEEPRPAVIVEAGRGLRRFGGLLNIVPWVHVETEPNQTPYRLKRQINDDVLTLSHTVRERVGEDVLETGAVIETAGYGYELKARAHVLDDESLKVTTTQLDITSEAGVETRLLFRAEEVPPAYNHAELREPQATVTVVDGQHTYGFDDYAPIEQQNLTDVVHRVATDVDQAKVLRVHNGGQTELLH